MGDQKVDKNLKTFMKSQKKPILEHVNGEEYLGVYQEFYKTLMKK
jgi:hypothetical protein